MSPPPFEASDAVPDDGEEVTSPAVPPVDALFNVVYSELRSLAQGALRRQRPDHTLQPTALVHEVWLKLSASLDGVESRGHYLAIATKAMRQILQDHARAHRADKRGQRAPGVQVEDSQAPVLDHGVDLVAIEDTLTKLAGLNQRHARIVELRILGGLTMPEVAEEMGLSQRTVESDWMFARAWLRAELSQR